MTRRHSLAVVALAVLLAGSAAAPALANTDTEASYADRMLGIDDEKASVSWIDKTIAGTQGKLDGVVDKATTLTNFNHEVSPEKKLRTVQRFYNEHSETFLAYANQRVNATGEHDVVKITFQYKDLNATRYLVATVEDGNYTSARIQHSPSNIESSAKLENNSYMVRLEDGTIDHRESLSVEVDDTLTLKGQAVENAPRELERFYQSFIKDNEDASMRYLIRVGAHYQGDVESSLITAAQTEENAS
jgi:hypothetical protein